MNLAVQKNPTKSQLSELALDAAIELDLIANKGKGNANIVESFIVLLKEQLGSAQEGSLFKDQTLYPVYSFALSKTSGEAYTPKETMGNVLIDVINKYHDRDGDVSKLDYLKTFCLSVHEALISDLMGRRISSVKQDDRIR
jgi:hypothetical protein